MHLVIGEEFTEFDNNEASIEQIMKTIEEKPSTERSSAIWSSTSGCI